MLDIDKGLIKEDNESGTRFDILEIYIFNEMKFVKRETDRPIEHPHYNHI